VPNHPDLDHRRVVVDGVDNPVITDPDTPKVIGAPQFLQPAGRACSASESIFFAMRSRMGPGSDSSSFVAERPSRTSCTTTPLLEAAGLLQSGPNRRPAFGWLAFPRSRRGDIEDVFPQAASLPKIDHHGGSLAMLVKQELYAANH
jgi:hypothetical protein